MTALCRLGTLAYCSIRIVLVTLVGARMGLLPPFPMSNCPASVTQNYELQNMAVTVRMASRPPRLTRSPDLLCHCFLNTLAQTLDLLPVLALLSHTQLLEPKSIEDN